MRFMIDWLGQVASTIALFYAIGWLANWALEQTLRTFKAYRYFCEYIWHRETFRKWLKETYPK